MKVSGLELKRRDLLRGARFSLGGLLLLLCLLIIATVVFKAIDPKATITFRNLLITIGVLAAGWVLLAFAVKKRMEALRFEVSLSQTIRMIFGRPVEGKVIKVKPVKPKKARVVLKPVPKLKVAGLKLGRWKTRNIKRRGKRLENRLKISLVTSIIILIVVAVVGSFKYLEVSRELGATQNELSQTQNELAQTSEQLFQTQNELTQTSEQLTQTQNDLAQTSAQLAQAIENLNFYKSVYQALQRDTLIYSYSSWINEWFLYDEVPEYTQQVTDKSNSANSDMQLANQYLSLASQELEKANQSFNQGDYLMAYYYSLQAHQYRNQAENFMVSAEIKLSELSTIAMNFQLTLLNSQQYVEVSVKREQYIEWASRSRQIPGPITVEAIAQYVNVNDPAVSALRPILVGKFSDQEKQANHIIGYVHTLTDYYLGKEYYHKYPVETFAEGSGECVDLSILAASLYKACGFDVALVTFTGHILPAVHLDSPPTFTAGWHITQDGKNYYFAETTGEGWLVGDLASSYQNVTPVGVYVIP